ncbi:MAG: LLM class flavin-dependent oxidoreductase [Polyangiaceae bacterium]|nr:LLM class flavin-dependent oxidoreductase [Polyangiaceae bacterium]MCB9606110.1 LLM class flavin-dependent oxidoreductase [Polyangiaceae bacterium]
MSDLPSGTQPRTKHRISMHLTGLDARELVESAREAEAAGVESLWASELYTNPWVQLAAVAPATKSITLGTGVVLGFVRSPMALGVAALDLDQLTRRSDGNGRFVLGLGTGVKQLNQRWHGVTNFGGPVRHMRELIEFLRLFFAKAHTAEPINYHGEFIHADIDSYRRPGKGPATPIPIYLGANQPRMLELAGEVADGVLGHVFISPRALKEFTLPHVEAGLKKAGRSRSQFTLGAGITTAISKDRATARRHARGPLAFYATVRTYSAAFEADGFGAEVAAIRKAFQAGERETLLDLVSDAMVDTYCAAGTLDEVMRRLEDYDGLLDVKGVSPPRHFCPTEAHREYRRAILEAFS